MGTYSILLSVCSAKYHYWIIDGITISVLTALLIISWYKKLWIMYFSDTEQSLPQYKLSRMLYKMSDYMQRSIGIRLTVYMLVVFSCIAVTAMQVVGLMIFCLICVI